LFLVFYIVQILTVALVFRNWWMLGAYIVLLPLSGLFAWWYWIRMVKSRGKGRLLKLMRKDRETVEELIGLRLEIVQEAERMRAL
jgi:membrane protein implicated in regulation of membrane protease activity